MSSNTPTSSANVPNTWIVQALLAVLAAGGGGTLGSLVSAPSTDVLEVQVMHLGEKVASYTESVEEGQKELERRIERLEAILLKPE